MYLFLRHRLPMRARCWRCVSGRCTAALLLHIASAHKHMPPAAPVPPPLHLSNGAERREDLGGGMCMWCVGGGGWGWGGGKEMGKGDALVMCLYVCGVGCRCVRGAGAVSPADALPPYYCTLQVHTSTCHQLHPYPPPSTCRVGHSLCSEEGGPGGRHVHVVCWRRWMGMGWGRRRRARGMLLLLLLLLGETQHAWLIYPNSSVFHMQGSYHVGNTASRLISEVKQR